MRRHTTCLLIGILLLSLFVQSSFAQANASRELRFEISFPATVHAEPLTGRMFLAFALNDEREPRLQVGRYGVQVFGVDFENLAPGESVVIDESTLGYPVGSLSKMKAGAYYVQAVLNKYTEFKRSDGHTVYMHMDQWEGQNWRRSPGNLIGDVVHLSIDLEEGGIHRMITATEIPPIGLPANTPLVQRFRIQSDILTEFWGYPIYIGATVLLPRGYDEHPDVFYPTVYQQGHFSTRAPLRFREGTAFYDAWLSDGFPRFIAVTIQHPTPYFDDSYAVNSVNNGPYGDAIHEELIPEIEKRYRLIRESYARVLTGGSTGGWEAAALQIFYPDFYGGSWAFAPDPLDFRNVEGINIYEYENAFYTENDWYKVPITNTRDHVTGAVRLTSKQRNTMELVNGTKGRSGEQLDIWSAVFGPVGENGYFKPLFDKRTGEIDPIVAEYWREHYDLRHILERDWATLGPKLVGKLHFYCGRMDNFFLNFGVYYMEDFLESTSEPYYAGSFTYGPRGGHGWRPFGSDELLRQMAAQITANAPVGADTNTWKY